MKKYVIALILCLCVLAFAGRGRYDPMFWRAVPGGIEYTGGDVTVSGGNLISSGGVGDLIPDANDTYDLGSSTKLWKELYLMGSSLHIGAYTLQQDAVDNDGLEIAGSFHAAIVGGISGNFCIHEGSEPAASNASDGSRLWVDASGNLQHQKSSDAGGGSKKVIVDDGAGNVGIGTSTPLEVLQVEGNNAALRLQDDSGNYAILKVGDSQLTFDADPDDAVASTDIVFKMDGSEVARFYVGGGGSFGIGTITPDAKLEVNGYTMLGSDAPKIKVKKITGTTDAGAQTAIAHGLTASKILNVFSTIQNNNTYYYVPNMFTSGNSNYYYHTWETTNIYFSGVGSGLQSRPYKILIIYEE